MTATEPGFSIRPLPDARFGGVIEIATGVDAPERTEAAISAAEAAPDALLSAFYDVNGFLLLKGMHAITEHPDLLVRLSRLFGP